MNKLIPTLLLAVLSFNLFAQPTTQGHSLFNTMPDYAVDQNASNTKKEFDQMKIYQADKTVNDGYVELSKEGELEVCTFAYKGDEAKTPSTLQILRNFKNAVAQKGGEMIYEDDFYKDKVYFKLKKGSDTYWIKVYCDGIGNYTISSIKEIAMKQDIVLSADDIKAALSSDGKVAFYGIYFDTDKAVLKPESASALTGIADFLKKNPTVNVYVVGHTDNTGNFDRNTTLSKDRATAVVTELTGKYGVNKNQVTAQGVGSLAPVANNATEEGKAKNRRVEIIYK